MERVLVTGGTVFVSRFIAQYFKDKGYEVYVLNRNTRKQIEGVHLICANRNDLNNQLKSYNFDKIIDVCAYNQKDIKNLLDALNEVKDYIFISSSAVYPETNIQPFHEEQEIGENSIWGKYGIDKVQAEQYLQSHCPQAYILRPPYLYGPMQNLYREPFVFDCALNKRPFYIPKDGKMKLQFFHVEDLCKVIEAIWETHPQEHIFNVGNEEPIDINTFVEICYRVVNQPLKTIHIYNHENQRDYFSFHEYEYILDITKQKMLLPKTKDLEKGFKESFQWYIQHENDVKKKDYIQYIDKHF